MSNTKFQPLPIPLPFAVFDEFGKGADDRVQDYAAAAVAAERARWSVLAAHVRCVEHAHRVGALEASNVRMTAQALDNVLGPNVELTGLKRPQETYDKRKERAGRFRSGSATG